MQLRRVSLVADSSLLPDADASSPQPLCLGFFHKLLFSLPFLQCMRAVARLQRRTCLGISSVR